MTVQDRVPANEYSVEHLLPFETLYERYYPRIYRYLRAHLNNDEDVADLVQQIFFQVWRQISTYQPGRGTFATWLFSIAHHRLVDFYRTVRPIVSWETICEITLLDSSPEDIVISAEIYARAKALIEDLSPAEQELLSLRFAARLSIAEIAAIQGKSVAATKKQLARLIERLREQYRRQDLEELLTKLAERVTPTFISVLQQFYTVPLPSARLFVLRTTVLVC